MRCAEDAGGDDAAHQLRDRVAGQVGEGPAGREPAERVPGHLHADPHRGAQRPRGSHGRRLLHRCLAHVHDLRPGHCLGCSLQSRGHNGHLLLRSGAHLGRAGARLHSRPALRRDPRWLHVLVDAERPDAAVEARRWQLRPRGPDGEAHLYLPSELRRPQRRHDKVPSLPVLWLGDRLLCWLFWCPQRSRPPPATAGRRRQRMRPATAGPRRWRTRRRLSGGSGSRPRSKRPRSPRNPWPRRPQRGSATATGRAPPARSRRRCGRRRPGPGRPPGRTSRQLTPAWRSRVRKLLPAITAASCCASDSP
mmetsp:Transcript_71909/g.227230  ORF Transcript_71909/g.227230 Transcript_71909/m.227230 type:complete len:307 (+) Transcript_71909:138-1058(+)